MDFLQFSASSQCFQQMESFKEKVHGLPKIQEQKRHGPFSNEIDKAMPHIYLENKDEKCQFFTDKLRSKLQEIIGLKWKWRRLDSLKIMEKTYCTQAVRKKLLCVSRIQERGYWVMHGISKCPLLVWKQEKLLSLKFFKCFSNTLIIKRIWENTEKRKTICN